MLRGQHIAHQAGGAALAVQSLLRRQQPANAVVRGKPRGRWVRRWARRRRWRRRGVAGIDDLWSGVGREAGVGWRLRSVGR